MNQDTARYLAAGVALLLVAAFVWGLAKCYRHYTGLPTKSIFLSIVAMGIAVALVIIAHEYNYPDLRERNNHHLNGFYALPDLVPMFILPLLVVPFTVRLYRKYIGAHLTPQETAVGVTGLRAWLSPGNVVCATLIPLLAWQAYECPLLELFLLTFGLILAYPLYAWSSAAPMPATAGPVEDLASERERVLRMLESGRITAEESAELLNALSHTVAPRPTVPAETPLSPQRKLVLAGAVLLLVGFFLPWFVINTREALTDAMGQMQQMVGDMTQGANISKFIHMDMPNSKVEVHAGELNHGLGWWVLILGVVAAVLPFFSLNLAPRLQKQLTLAALAVGGFILIYAAHDAVRYVSAGLILAVVGYGMELIGTWKDRTMIR